MLLAGTTNNSLGADAIASLAFSDDAVAIYTKLPFSVFPYLTTRILMVSPSQYGFISTKHLCRIEVHTAPPEENYGYANTLARVGLRGPLFQRHPRSRVWHEERHRYLPGWPLRPVYRLLIPPIRLLSARGGQRKS